MTPAQKSILSDLNRQLAERLVAACEHFVDMAQVADLPRRESAEAILHTFLYSAATAIYPGGMSQEVFAQTAYNIFACAAADFRNFQQTTEKPQ